MDRVFYVLLLFVMVCAPVFAGEAMEAGEEETPNTEQLCKEARQLIEDGKMDAATPLIREAIAADRNCAEAHLLQGDIFFKQKTYPRARDSYEKAIVLGTVDAQCQIDLAFCYFRTFSFEKAKESLRIAFELDPKNPKVYTELSSVFYRLQNYDTAWWYIRQGSRHKAEFPPEAVESLNSKLAKPEKFPKRRNGFSVTYSPGATTSTGQKIPDVFTLKEKDKNTDFPAARALIEHVLKEDESRRENGIWMVLTCSEDYVRTNDRKLKKLEDLSKKEKVPFIYCLDKNLPDGWFRTH